MRAAPLRFFYDREDVIQEYDSDWSTVTNEDTHGPWIDEPLSMTEHTTGQPNSTYYLMKDRLGSIINILDENETLKTTYSYDAFGEPTATYHSGQVDCAYRFAGREFDSGMGNYFSRARYYNQSLGRFFSRDPIMSLGSLYAYCNNSPANYRDPTGMNCSGASSYEACIMCCDLAFGLEIGWSLQQFASDLFVSCMEVATLAGIAGAVVYGAAKGGMAIGGAVAGTTGAGIGGAGAGGTAAKAISDWWSDAVSEAREVVEDSWDELSDNLEDDSETYDECTGSCEGLPPQGGSGGSGSSQKWGPYDVRSPGPIP